MCGQPSDGDLARQFNLDGVSGYFRQLGRSTFTVTKERQVAALTREVITAFCNPKYRVMCI